MQRLYFRIYLAVLGSLALFALLAGIAWHLADNGARFGPRPGVFVDIAMRVLPPADASPAEQREALENWHARSGFDMALFDADLNPIGATRPGGLPMPPPETLRDRGFRSGPGHPGEFVLHLPDGRWLVIARPPHPVARLLGPFGGPGPLGLVLGLALIALAVGVCAFPVVRRLTRGLERLQSSVEALGAGDLKARVPVEGRDEVARLAHSFNHAAARIETLVNANRTLLANASHELRSPLTRLRMGVEMCGEALPEGAQVALRAEMARDVAELDQLIDEILLASRLDAQVAGQEHFDQVDIVGLAAEECARAGATLDAAGAAGVTVRGDARLLRRLLRNLLENARRHGVDADNVDRDAHVEVHLRIAAESLEIEVRDRGPGVPDAERERIFEPFYRPAGRRERDGGVGLGLALVRQIAARHGGQVTCLARDGGGSCFLLRLPRNA